MPSSSRAMCRSALLPLALAAAMSPLNGLAMASTAVSGWTDITPTAFLFPRTTDLGAADTARPLNLMVVLKLRNQAALNDTLQHITTPGDALYKHYLRPDQFAASYGPSMSDAAGLIDYLHAQGFSNIELSDNRTQIRMQGTVGLAQKAFNTQLHTFQYQGKDVLANVTPAQLPAGFGPATLAIVGLNTVPSLHHNLAKSGLPNLAPGASPDPNSLLTTHDAASFQKIYDATGTPAASKVSIAIIAEGVLDAVMGTHPEITNPKDPNFDKGADLRLYETANSLPYVPATVVKTGYAPEVADPTEYDMDTQTSSGIAGNLKHLYVYDGDYLDDLEILAAYNRFTTDDLAMAASSSFGGCETQEQTNGFLAPYDQEFMQMAAQGQTMFASSGDNGSACIGLNGVTPYAVEGVSSPASATLVMAVGGTTLSTDSSGAYATEILWSYSGGNTSTFEKVAAWQMPFLPAPTGFKSVPDMVMDGDANTGANFYSQGSATTNGGTSLASPLALGAWARIQSAHVAAGDTSVNPNPLGYAPPDLYALGVSTTAAAGGTTPAGFHDITVGSNGLYEAAPGWDLASGLGSFDIAAAIPAMKAIAPGLAAPPALGGDICGLPGYAISFGTRGSAADNPVPGHTALETYVSEKYTAGQPDGLTFSMDIDAAPAAAQTVYFVYFATPDGVRHYVAYEPTPDPTTGAAPFTYGHMVANVVVPPVIGGSLAALYFPMQDGSLPAADGSVSSAAIKTSDGGTGYRITWNLPRSAIPGLTGPTRLTRIFSEVDTETGYLDQNGSASTNTASAVSGTGQGIYTVDAPYHCAPLPTAALTATPTTVVAGDPVAFNASGSKAVAPATVATYIFSFGDGTSVVSKTSQVTHAYAIAGQPVATVAVTDSYGNTSTNVASQAVTVTVPPAPNAFGFGARTNVADSVFVTSETVTMAGTPGASYAISVAGGSNMQYSINGGAFTSAAGTIAIGDKLAVRHTSAATDSTTVTTSVTIGTYTTNFVSTTGKTIDTVPDAFTFGEIDNVAPGTQTVSKTVTPVAYDSAQVVAGPGMSYSINGGAFTSAGGTITKGQSITARLTSSAGSLVYTRGYISIGGVHGTFTTRNKR